MESWEEEETNVISKLLMKSNENLEEEVDTMSDVLSKSLHEEFMEIGESFDEPDDAIGPPHDDLELSSISRKRSSLQCIMDEFHSISKMVDRKLSQSSCSVASVKMLTDNEYGSVNKQGKTVRPPPGFRAQLPLTSSPRMMRQSNHNVINTEIKLQSDHSADAGIKWRKANDFLKEFESLSTIMDEELSNYASNIHIMREQKQCLQEQVKNQGKVDILKTLLYQQRDKMKIAEKKYKQKLLIMEEKFKEEIERLLIIVNSNKQTSRELQSEYNKALNQRESEIETLYAEVNNLQGQLETYEGGTDDIAMENEELHELVEIKDEYIASLRLQIKNHEKIHTQDQWKLEQADDLLEMVERERDRIEEKAKEVILQLRHELSQEHAKNSERKSISQPANVTKSAIISKGNENNNTKNSDSGKNSERKIKNENSVVTRAAENKTNGTIKNSNPGNAKDLGVEAREKLMKIAHRSSSMRRSTVIDCSDKDKVPKVLKSLGWFTPSS